MFSFKRSPFLSIARQHNDTLNITIRREFNYTRFMEHNESIIIPIRILQKTFLIHVYMNFNNTYF